MKIKNISVKNIASFENFSFDCELRKKNLIFGTNGSGKSTLASLIQSIDRFKSNNADSVSENELCEFISNKISRESLSNESSILIHFEDKLEEVKYIPGTKTLKYSNGNWSPVRVFNDKYTERTIGDIVDINIKESGLVIGEPNKKLEEAQKKRNGLVKKSKNYQKKIIDLVLKFKKEYETITNKR